MGVVYEAEDNLLNRRVAVKLLPYKKNPGARILERFFVEAQVAARLNHPNIIGIYDIGERSGTFFIVMELLNELSLGSYLRRRGALSWQEATRIAADCCSALHEAHLVGLVHRDIKPDNILCSPTGSVKVADFGLVKELTQTGANGVPFTQENAVLGSPQYMSPEQCRSNPVDSRSDIYSLGATYYTMLTGQAPYDGSAPMAFMVHHCSSPTPDPRRIVPEIPQVCVDILELAMQKEPDERFQTAADMRAALEAVLANEAPVSYSFLLPSNAPRQPARNRQVDELRAALEAQHGDGATLDVSSQQEVVSAAASPAAPVAPARPAADTDSIDERRIAMLEAALARAPTARVSIPSRRRFFWDRHGKKLTILAVGMALLAIAFVGSQFRRLMNDGNRGVQAAVRPTIKVGVVHSLSGPLSQMARPVADATLLAIDDLNEQGGLLGSTIEAVVVDGKSDVESFAAATERLLTREKVQVVFGGLHAESRRGIRQAVETHDHLLLYPGTSEGLEDSPNIFFLGGVPSQRSDPALHYAIQTLGSKRIFLLGSSQLGSYALSTLIQSQIKDLGGKVVGERLLPADTLDFAATLKKIALAEPELVVSTLRGDANVIFFRAWQKRDKRMQNLHVLSLSLDENILTLLDDVDLSQNYVAGNYFQAVPRKENAQFIERFRKKYGAHHVITEEMEAAYSGVYLWAQAVRAARDFKVREVRQALKAQTLQAPGATYQFEPNINYAWKAFHLARIAPGNKLELLESSPATLRPQIFPPSRTRAQWEALLDHM